MMENNHAPMFVSDPTAKFSAKSDVTVISPAKVNLVLAVHEKDATGYHKAVTIMHALTLHDKVKISLLDDDKLTTICNDLQDAEGTVDINTEISHAKAAVGAISAEDAKAAVGKEASHSEASHRTKSLPEIIVQCDERQGIDAIEVPSQDNIAYKAATAFFKEFGWSTLPQIPSKLIIRIEKSIPAQAGLGGGSSNAAATLVGLAKLCNISSRHPKLPEIAANIGVDVAFFLRGSCACMQGYGEKFSHALAPMNKNVAIIKPEGGVSTAQAYANFDSKPISISAEAKAACNTAKEAADVKLFNNLYTAAALTNDNIEAAYEWLSARVGVENALLCGSGAAIFAICDSFAEACEIAAKAKLEGYWARTTTFSATSAMVVEK